MAKPSGRDTHPQDVSSLPPPIWNGSGATEQREVGAGAGGVVVDKLARGKNHSDQMEPQIVTKGGYGRSGAAGRENSALLLALREQRGGDLLKKKIMMKNTHTHTRRRAMQ